MPAGGAGGEGRPTGWSGQESPHGVDGSDDRGSHSYASDVRGPRSDLPGDGGPHPHPPVAEGATPPPASDRRVATTFPCAACGAQVRFEPGTQELTCPYCGIRQAVPVDEFDVIDEHDYVAWRDSPDKPTGVVADHVMACPRCGASVDSPDLSLLCPFCSAPIVAEIDPREQVIPEGVVPFGLTKNQAVESMRKWTSSRWFAPGGLKKVTTAERIHGTYVPHWTYDANTRTQYSGMRGEHYYDTETYTDNEGRTQTRTVQRTRWWPASGQVGRFFDDVLVPASTHLPPATLHKLEPWTLEKAAPFRQDYLSGFQALRYDVQPENGLESAKDRMRPIIESDCRADIGGDVQRLTSVSTAYSDVTFKLMLLPLWVAAYLYAGKPYTVYVNAFTGHVVGERPYSIPKIVAAVVAAIVLAVLAFFGYRHFNEGGSPAPTSPTRTAPAYPTRTTPAAPTTQPRQGTSPATGGVSPTGLPTGSPAPGNLPTTWVR